MPDPILGFGTLLAVDRGSGYATVARNVELGEFGPEADDVETTSHDSSAGHREFIRGLVDSGELSFTGIWVGDTTQTDLMADLIEGTGAADSIDAWKITIPGGYGTFICQGFLTSFKISPQMDGRVECSGTIKLTGVASFATTVSAGLTTPFLAFGSSGVCSPAASQTVTTYVVTVLTAVTSITVTPTAAAGVITVNGAVVASGVASTAIALGSAGSLTTITVVVTETAKAPKTYTITVVRP